MQHETVIVLDFGGQYNQLIARRVRENNVYCEIYSYKTDLSVIKAKNPKGIIFTGGPNSVYLEDSPTIDPEIFSWGVPVLGICYGSQLMMHLLGGRVCRAPEREYGKTEVFVDNSSKMFTDVQPSTVCWMSHNDYIEQAAPGFKITAHTVNCPVAAAENEEKGLYAVQFHPEVLHTAEGKKMLHNFVYNVCGCTGDWKMDSFVENNVEALRKRIGSGKVLCALSGGVDSSVSAWLLQQQGYQVEGLFMKNWEEDDGEEYCTAAADLADAQAVCDKLGIELHTVNFAAEYWDNVFELFLAEYKAGRTPNPDILCNKEIKFKAFLEFAAEDLGADYIATGHYVRRADVDGKSRLLRGLDSNKDQSYFLYTLSHEQIAQSLFPVGELEKPQVRKIAEDLGLVTAKKKDSTGICFIGERKFREFLGRYLPAQPGKIITVDGDEIGEHQGLMYHTLGQRKGLGIGGTKEGTEEPWYVVDKDVENNILVVAQGHEHPRLMSVGLIAQQLHWVDREPFTGTMRCTVKTRYRQTDIPCTVKALDDDRIEVIFDEPVAAVTPGQSAVFYNGEVCLGGGIIEQRLPLPV